MNSDAGPPQSASTRLAAETTAEKNPFRSSLSAWPIRSRSVRDRVLTLVEIVVLLIWTIVFTFPYLNLDPNVVPIGDEFLPNIESFHIWNWMRECGACAFWFGGTNGGWPAAVDVNASTFHPLVAVATLIWGVLNGSKVTLVVTFFLAGVAQWWLAKILGLGRAARVWTSCLAVVAGSLASRMALGSVGMALSPVAAAFLWPPVILLSRTGRRREIVILAIAAASLLLAGNGYMQVGVVFLAPATLLLLGREKLRLLPRYFFAAGLALLLAAPVLAPFLHFWPNFGKSFEPDFHTAQPFAYVSLNLLINDHAFYRSDALGKLAGNPFLYELFVGWVPVLLAFWGLRSSRNREERQVVVFLAALVLLSFWIASGEPQKLLIRAFPFRPIIRFVAGVSHPSFMAGLAIPPLLGLAALGLDRVLAARWPAPGLTGSGRTFLSVIIKPRWLMAIPLIGALLSARNFVAPSIGTFPLFREVPLVIATLRTDDLQWISVPEKFWIDSALKQGLKLTNFTYLTWQWVGRAQPDPTLVFTRGEVPVGMTEQATLHGMRVFKAPPGSEYAAVTTADGRRVVCTARGRGGNIDVLCDTAAPGILVVKENSWTGWKARTARGSLRLLPGQWLAVQLPPGHNLIRFRYRPWDVPLGLFLCACGVALCAREIARDRRSQTIALPRTGLENPPSAPPPTVDLPATRSDP